MSTSVNKTMTTSSGKQQEKPKTQEELDAEALEALEATWGEVAQQCCVHTGTEWFYIFLGVCATVFFLYFFLFGLDLIGTGAKVMAGCRAGSLFGDDTNPVAGLMVGVISTVLIQSSSTTTSIVVSLVPSVISAKQGIYMIMGANIGTTITNTLVSLGQMGNIDQLERAFAGATVHDAFNILTVLILFPLEIATGFLYRLTKAMVKNITIRDDEEWEGPIAKLVEPLTGRIITDNSSFIRAIAKGEKSCKNGEGTYPLKDCEEGDMNAETCPNALIKCLDEWCPAFYQENAKAEDDKISGGVCFVLGLVVLFLCMWGLVHVLQKMLLSVSTRILHKSTSINGYIGIILGCGITMLVQSSSITTSVLTPFVGLGAIQLEQMFPMTLGANLGTTLTALLASLVSNNILSLQVAFAHLMFNVVGTVIWYPLPFLRQIPLGIARWLGRMTRVWRGFPFLYIGVTFFAVPLTIFGVSLMFTQGSLGLTVLGSFMIVGIVLGLAYFVYWLKYKGGDQRCLDGFERRGARRMAWTNLSDDMAYLKRNMARVLEHTGLEEDNDNKNDAAPAPRAAPAAMVDDDDDEKDYEVEA